MQIDILPQPDDITCGPTCLHAVYRYFGDDVPLEDVIQQTPSLEEGGTLGVQLGCHALHRGFDATIYTYNLRIFDPTWFCGPTSEDVGQPQLDLVERLQTQMEHKDSQKMQLASEAYIRFLASGGQIRMEDLTGDLLRYYLNQSIPILTGLSATYLYAHPREIGATNKPDDIRGTPAGHFVVLSGYDRQRGTVTVADPYLPNPLGPQHHYDVDLDRLVCAILLGVLTYDANLLIIEPRANRHSQNP